MITPKITCEKLKNYPFYCCQNCIINIVLYIKQCVFLCALWKEQDHIMQGLKYKEQKTFGKRVKKNHNMMCLCLCVELEYVDTLIQDHYPNTTYHLCLQWSSSNYKTTSLLRNINKRIWKSMFTLINNNTLKIEND